MRCETCQATLTIQRVDKISDVAKKGRYRVYLCNICEIEYRSFEPVGHQEVIIESLRNLRLCDCGAVATHAKPIVQFAPFARGQVKRQTLHLCDDCNELERVQVRPARVEREVTWRAVYTS